MARVVEDRAFIGPSLFCGELTLFPSELPSDSPPLAKLILLILLLPIVPILRELDVAVE